MMKVIGGRVADFLVTPEGAVVSGAAMTIYFVAQVPGIAQAQLEQTERERLIVRVVRDEGYGLESERRIAEAVSKFFGERMRHDIEQVDEIATSASGKHQFSICRLDPLDYL
jgi:hypothetical protein